MAKAHFVKKARKDNPAVQKGEPYYWWSFRFGGKHFSATPPRRSQLTSSPFLSQLYGIEEELEEARGLGTEADLEQLVEEIVALIDGLMEETETSLSNMPDNLQQGPTGELLQERIDGLEAWKDELEAVDLTIVEIALEEEARGEVEEGITGEEEPGEVEASIQNLWNQKIEEEAQEKLMELQNTSSNL